MKKFLARFVAKPDQELQVIVALIAAVYTLYEVSEPQPEATLGEIAAELHRMSAEHGRRVHLHVNR